MADETDIYFSQTTTANPNILFVLDNSGSMEQNKIGSQTRMQVMQEAFGAVMDAVPSNLNVGLMRYGGHKENAANGVSFPVKPVDLDKDGNGGAKSIIEARIPMGQDNLPNPTGNNQPVREFLKDVANDWKAEGFTPIVDALYEAARYYRGENVLAGRLVADNVRAAHPSSYTGNLTWNATAGVCDAPYRCMKIYCSTSDTISNCAQETVSECVNWVQDKPTGECCEWEATGYNEAGDATGYQCKGNNYNCPTYKCGSYADKSHEICDAQHCAGQTDGVAEYISPIQYECQSNYIVLMSDGRPEYYDGINSLPPSVTDIKRLIAGTCAGAPNGYNSGTCGPELTKFLLEKDQAPTLDGDQLIQTFTIGFGLEDAAATNYLKALANVSGGALAANDTESLKLAFNKVIKRVQQDATPKLQLSGLSASQPLPETPTTLDQQSQLAMHKPEASEKLLPSLLNPFSYIGSLAVGGFFEATDTQSLIDAFNSIINKVSASASSFSSPTYQVDQNTLLAHSEYVYIPVFDRNNLPLWPGNLKKFKRDATGQLIGKNGEAAVDEKGVFTQKAQDFWSDTVDGVDVTAGGAANKLPAPDSRTLLTDANGTTVSPLKNTNVNLTPDVFGLAATDTAMRDKLVDFIRGKKADGTPRNHMGDMLNGKPQIITNGMGTFILAASNEGYLHAIDVDTGIEKWAFMPKSLLKNVNTFYQNSEPKKHVSGIDGALQIWRFDNDANNNGSIDANEHYTYVYFGLRNGGSEYYMLDITDFTNPKVVWHVTDQTSGFAELGKAWSKPALAKMRVAKTSPENVTHDSELIDVLVFGGGYDPVKNDENTTTPAFTRAADSKGRDVFIVNAQTGALLWSLRDKVSGAAAKLQDSIPGDIRVLDIDRNGALDRLYFADTGGHIWRVDMDADADNGTIAPDTTLYDYSKARLSEFADLGGTGTNKRMFFYEPDVALTESGGKTVLTLAIGSGYRTRPLSQGDDRFYVLVDRSPYNPPDASIFPIKEDAKLVGLTKADGSDDTSKIGGSKTLLTETTLNGWYYDLPNKGEKVLAPAVTVLNKVVFTTFASDAGVSTDPCNAPPNSARAYVLDLLNGAAVADLNRSKDGVNERSVVAGVNEILDSAQVVFSNPTTATGTACTNSSDCTTQFVEIRVGKMNLPLVDKTNAPGTRTNIGDILPRMFWREDLGEK
jgi:Tfp pilus tip-associated adhesin PilY1